MNPLQMTMQVISTLAGTTSGTPNFTWPDSPNEAVFSRVLAGVGVPSDFFQQDAAAPYAFLHVDATRDHEEFPADLVDEQRWTLYMFAANASSQSGGEAVVGGNRESLGSSRGRGLLEVESLVKAALFNSLGLVARPRTGGAQPVNVAGKQSGLIAERVLDIVATRLPSFPDYNRVQKLLASVAGGVVSLSWAAPSTRYDLVGFTWAKASGSTAPTSPSAGTFVAGTTHVLSDSPGAGTWSYSIWNSYDATVDPFTGTGVVPVAANRWSSSQTAQNGVVYYAASVTVSV